MNIALLCLLVIAAVYAVGIRSRVSVLRDRLKRLRELYAEQGQDLVAAECRIAELEDQEDRTRAALARVMGPDAADRLDLCLWAFEVGTVEIEEEL